MAQLPGVDACTSRSGVCVFFDPCNFGLSISEKLQLQASSKSDLRAQPELASAQAPYRSSSRASATWQEIALPRDYKDVSSCNCIILNNLLNNLKNLENFTEFSQNFAHFPKIVTTSEISGPVREIPTKVHQNLDEK